MKMGEAMYKDQQAESDGGAEEKKDDGDDVVDADFEEVDKDNK